MRSLKKIILGTLAVVLLAGATPAAAQLTGLWRGEGEGICPPPFPTPLPVMMNPWQYWEGQIPNSQTAFSGRWWDGPGYHGTFNGRIIASTPEYALCTGQWTAIDDRVDPPRVYVMGPFQMRFYYRTLECKGEWYSRSSIYSGTMYGEKVE